MYVLMLLLTHPICDVLCISVQWDTQCHEWFLKRFDVVVANATSNTKPIRSHALCTLCGEIRPQMDKKNLQTMTCLCTQCSHRRNYKMISLLARSTSIIRRFNIICATSVPSVVHVGRTAVVERLYKFYLKYVLKWYFTELVFQWGKDGRMFLRIVYERARTNRMLLSRLRMSMTSCVTNAKAFDCVNFLRVTLWPWPLPYNLEQLSYMASHVTNPATKFEDPKTIRAGDTSYNGSRWLPLKMCTRPQRVRRFSTARGVWVLTDERAHTNRQPYTSRPKTRLYLMPCAAVMNSNGARRSLARSCDCELTEASWPRTSAQHL